MHAESIGVNLYSTIDHLYIWLRMTTIEKDYNLYVHFYEKSKDRE